MVLSLPILKRGPKSYTFLRSLFSLPSRQTLQTILNTFLCRTGFIGHVFSTHECTLQIADDDCVFCLKFDEMSIRENL
jgi:hypothetical protein